MKTSRKIALLIPILFLTAVFVYAQEVNQASPPAAPPSELQGGPGFMLDEKYIADLLEKVKQNDPNKAQRLENLRQEDPRLFQVEMRKLAFQQHREARQGPPDEESIALRGKDRGRNRNRDMETEFISWLEKNEPEKAKELAALKEKDPFAYPRRLSIEMKKYREIIDAEQTNPALAELLKKDLGLKQNRNELLEKLKGTTDEKQKEELTAQLKRVVSERFAIEVQKKQLKYEELKKKLEELQNRVNKSQAELKNFKNKKTEYIDTHMKDLPEKANQLDKD